MTVRSKINLGNLLHSRASFPENDLAEQYAGGEPPLRSELFSANQMEQHGKTLVDLHELSQSLAPDRPPIQLAIPAHRRTTPRAETGNR